MKTSIFLIVLSTFLLSGCMAAQRQGMTSYEQYSDKSGQQMFKYMAMSTVFYPTYSSDAENTRMELLNVWLSDNNYCLSGYEIVDKKMISRSSDENAKNITYIGRCK